MSKGFVAVQIAGQEYKIRSDSEDESLRQIAGYVDRAMKRVRDGTGTVDSLDVAVLTCLNLAREILALHEKRMDSSQDARLRALIEKVETLAPVSIAASEASQADSGSSAAQSSQSASESASRVSDEATSSAEVDTEASVRTLELPSADSLSDPTAPSAASSDGASTRASEVDLPTQRVAAGGRDRAS